MQACTHTHTTPSHFLPSFLCTVSQFCSRHAFIVIASGLSYKCSIIKEKKFTIWKDKVKEKRIRENKREETPRKDCGSMKEKLASPFQFFWRSLWFVEQKKNLFWFHFIGGPINLLTTTHEHTRMQKSSNKQPHTHTNTRTHFTYKHFPTYTQ